MAEHLPVMSDTQDGFAALLPRGLNLRGPSGRRWENLRGFTAGICLQACRLLPPLAGVALTHEGGLGKAGRDAARAGHEVLEPGTATSG